MAQTEDTELRDLVIDALEKNGSLAKIRALLRANIFLAFEDDRDNIKQNASLDNIFTIPEGVLSLSIIHEFLEFCNLKNTLFVYMSESRQCKEYNYDGKKALMDKLNIKQDVKEPILLTLLKTLSKLQHTSDLPGEKHSDANYKDEQNSSYIVHEDSQSSTTNSNSDNSSDEKNKLQLRLQLDNSDTDTSSDSARDKSGSEYIPSDFTAIKNDNMPQYSKQQGDTNKENMVQYMSQTQHVKSELLQQKANTSSSDSTSYVDIKSFNVSNKLLNVSELGKDVDPKQNENSTTQSQKSVDVDKSSTQSNVSSLSLKIMDKEKSKSYENKSSHSTGKSELQSADYSYDFSSSPKKLKDTQDQGTKSISLYDNNTSPRNINVLEGQNHSPPSSRSSVSISDVADLLSDRSFSNRQNKSVGTMSNSKVNSPRKNTNSHNNILSDHSGELTESPIPSLSNLSLDIHSD